MTPDPVQEAMNALDAASRALQSAIEHYTNYPSESSRKVMEQQGEYVARLRAEYNRTVLHYSEGDV